MALYKLYNNATNVTIIIYTVHPNVVVQQVVQFIITSVGHFTLLYVLPYLTSYLTSYLTLPYNLTLRLTLPYV